MQINFFVNHQREKTVDLPHVPRIGDAVFWGFGSHYRCYSIIDVTWDVDPPEGKPCVNVALGPYLRKL